MVGRFIEEYVKKIALDPEAVSVTLEESGDGVVQVTIFSSVQDAGKIIGKHGKMISALKALVSGCKAKDGFSYRIVVKTDGSS